MENLEIIKSKLKDQRRILHNFSINSTDNSKLMTELLTLSSEHPELKSIYQLLLLIISNTQTDRAEFKGKLIESIDEIIDSNIKAIDHLSYISENVEKASKLPKL